jgi:hypothetical protein
MNLIRASRLELLEELARLAIQLSYHIANTDGEISADDPLLWDLHNVASQYEVYEHQRGLGFPKRSGVLPQYHTLQELRRDQS